MGEPRVLLLDGGLGTSLEDSYCVRFDASTPLWSSHLLVSDPHTLQSCLADFAAVPVDVLLTPTYQVSVEGFARTATTQFPGGVDRGASLRFLDDAVRITESAAGPAGPRIALSLGPYGACMVPSQEYSGRYDAEHSSMEQLMEWHLDRLRLFAGVPRLFSRIRYLAFETIPRVDEIVAIRKAVDASGILGESPDLKIWISCIFPRDRALPDGSPVPAIVAALLGGDITAFVPWAIGFNCSKVFELDGVLSDLEISLPPGEAPSLVMYPDGTNGEVYNTTTQTWERTGEDATKVAWETRMVDMVLRACQGPWPQILVGGCCKTSSDDLRRLRLLLSGVGLLERSDSFVPQPDK